MRKVNVYFIGTAGSGKTHLLAAFSEWLEFHQIDHVTVNLDPGSEEMPYTPDVDIRDYFTLSDVMLKYGVGPNGAQILSADLLGAEIDEIKDEIDYHDVPYVLIDTPGQMELFTLRRTSEIIINALGRDSAAVFLFDPVISKTPDGFVSITFLMASSIFRLKIPHIPVLSKCDLLGEREIERIESWSDPDVLYSELGSGVERELFHVVREAGLLQKPIPVSAKEGYGMEDIYDRIQEIFYGGEDMERILY